MRLKLVSIFVLAMLYCSCLGGATSPDVVEISNLKTLEEICEHYDSVEFNGTIAMEYAEFQVNLGPRLPGSQESAMLLTSFSENATGYEIETPSHEVEGMNATNLIARYSPENSSGEVVIFAAHYDSRDRAERDDNESRRDEPIDGANDGASGVAVLFELLPLIPSLNLSHDVWLILFDAEDQGVTPSMLGSKAWSENLSQTEIDSVSAFILLDMVGDIDLNFQKEGFGTPILWDTMLNLSIGLGLVENQPDCVGENGTDVYNPNGMVWITDDHVNARNVGIPAIDIIDVHYGDDSVILGGHFHTTNDTIDKISAESLGIAGKIVELGLRSGSWIDYQTDFVEVSEETTPSEEAEAASFSSFEKIIILTMSLLLIGGLVSMKILNDLEKNTKPREK